MDKLCQESLADCMIFGPDMRFRINAYNRARFETQRRDRVTSEALRNVENLDKEANVPVVDLFPHMVELAFREWDAYKGAFDTLTVAANLQQETIHRETVSNLLLENIKAKTQMVISRWISRVLSGITNSVSYIQKIMAMVIKFEMVIQPNHQKSLNQLRSIICEVIDADIYQLLEFKKKTQNLTTIVEKFEAEMMTTSFVSKVTDITLNWNVIKSIADVRIVACNLRIVTYIAKDITQLMVKATEGIELAVREKEAAVWALRATEMETRLQSIIALEKQWIISTLEKIHTAVSAVEPLFQVNANDIGTTIQQQVPQESLTLLLEVTYQMMDLQSKVAMKVKEQMEAFHCNLDTFWKASVQHQLVTQVINAYRRAIRTIEHVIIITYPLEKVDKIVGIAHLVHKIRDEAQQKLIQAQNEMARLTNFENKAITAEIFTLAENRIGNVPPTHAISSLSRRVAFNLCIPIKPIVFCVALPSMTIVPSSSSNLPTVTVSSPAEVSLEQPGIEKEQKKRKRDP
jgi:hypothetical protein